MKVIISKDYDELSQKAADFFEERFDKIKVLGLATGSTPIGLYKQLIKRVEDGKISFKDKYSVNLDEYIGLPIGHKESYREFMNDNLFNHVDIDIKNTNEISTTLENINRNGSGYFVRIHHELFWF